MTEDSMLAVNVIAIVILFMAGLAVAMQRSLESDHPPYIEYAGALAILRELVDLVDDDGRY